MYISFSLTNLKYWSRCEQVINRTLQLLSDLSVGYTSVRKLVKLEEVQFMLNNHTVSIICLLLLFKMKNMFYFKCFSLHRVNISLFWVVECN